MIYLLVCKYVLSHESNYFTCTFIQNQISSRLFPPAPNFVHWCGVASTLFLIHVHPKQIYSHLFPHAPNLRALVWCGIHLFPPAPNLVHWCGVASSFSDNNGYLSIRRFNVNSHYARKKLNPKILSIIRNI